MQFSAVLVAIFAAAATAKTCGINGALCQRDVSSVGFTAKAREWLRTRSAAVEAPVEAREAQPEAVEITI
ncbi:hypothetical protein SLS60_005519 [Paraconiothyrium brasiliense]|uniref:Uncharacterized protein n=1 Tax=Paraconiothyrium brasiliense TaxID=300254 RepID=A0ABR3RJ58_9PLEO